MTKPAIATQKTNGQSKPRANLSKTLLLLATVCVICAGQVSAQQSLGDLVAEGGFDWMIGRWTTTTDEGEKIQLIYRWQLDKHLVTMQLKTPEFEYHGMIFYVPAKDQVVQVGVDNRGGSGKGLWEPDGDKAVMKVEHTDVDGGTQRMALAHSRVSNETMKLQMYTVESTGELADEPWATLEFKRGKTKARKTDE